MLFRVFAGLAVFILLVPACKSPSKTSEVKDFAGEIKRVETDDAEGVIRIECKNGKMFCSKKTLFKFVALPAFACSGASCVCDQLKAATVETPEAFVDCNALGGRDEKDAATQQLQALFGSAEFFGAHALNF